MHNRKKVQFQFGRSEKFQRSNRRRGVNIKERISQNYKRLKQAKLGHGELTESEELISGLRRVIYGKEKISFEGWELSRVMAFLFVVNGGFHSSRHDERWRFFKHLAQLHILQHHADAVKLVEGGQYDGCCEISCDVWCSHWCRNDRAHPANRILDRHPDLIGIKK